MTTRGIRLLCIALVMVVGLRGTAAARTGQPRSLALHVRYVDSLHMEWRFSKAVTTSSVGQYLNAPKGGAILLIFATVRDIGSSADYYGVGSFAAAASPHGTPFTPYYITGQYVPQLSGGKLRPHESTKGWFAFTVPVRVRKAYVRINDAIDPNDDQVLFTVPVH